MHPYNHDKFYECIKREGVSYDEKLPLITPTHKMVRGHFWDLLKLENLVDIEYPNDDHLFRYRYEIEEEERRNRE